MAFFDRLRLRKADHGERGPDGKFVVGPVNSQKKRGDQAFEAAKQHIDDAQKAAAGGDEQQANFHLNMAHQYAGAGVQNHLMGNYLKDSKDSRK
jgi:hypothetical protein